MIPRRVVLCLVISAIVLPVSISVFLAVGHLLALLGDASGGQIMTRVSLFLGVVWTVSLICLSVVLGMNAVLQGGRRDEDDGH